MTAILSTRILSAHELFKQRHGRRLSWAAAGALAVLILLVLLLPEYRPTPYTLVTEATRLYEFELERIEEPPPPEREVPTPHREVVVAPGADPDVTIPDVRIEPFPTPIDPGWAVPDDTPFVAVAEKPRLLQGARAEYPEMARLAGLQGLVMVKVLVDVDGTVARVELLKGVHPLIDRPALAAARRLVFAPGTQRRMPVPCWVAVPFRFSLD